MVDFKINEAQLKILVDKILGQFAFLVQRELIRLFPHSFANRIEVIKEGADWIVGSNLKILEYYDKGTRPHVIEPKVKDALAFKWPTAPISPNGKGGGFVFKKVLHPGTEGKHIIEDLEKDKKLLQKFLDTAIRNVTR